MADPVIQRPLELAADVAVTRAVKWLTHHGYQVSAQSEREASLVHSGGVPPEPPRHGLKISSDGQALSATFLRASVFDAPPSAVDLRWFESVVDQLVKVVGSGKDAPKAAKGPKNATPPFCPECGTRTRLGAATCEMCGAEF